MVLAQKTTLFNIPFKKSSAVLDTSKMTAKLKSYTIMDFPEVNCLSVDDLTKFTAEQINRELATKKLSKSSDPGPVWTASDLGVDTKKFNRILKLELNINSKENVLSAIRELEKREDVLYAGPDYTLELFVTPNDEYYVDGYVINGATEYQWAIDNLSLPNAWNITKGSSAVRVGILDSGIQYDHPDLMNRIASGNVHRDFVSGASTPITNPTDPLGHGTYVAGIVGAQGNNKTSSFGGGVVGVCWDGVQLVSLCVVNAVGNSRSSWVATAINYAESLYSNPNTRIHVLNLSAGWTSILPGSMGRYDISLYTAISNYSGLFVCGAGNGDVYGVEQDNDLIPVYPSNYRLDNLISVGAITSLNTKWASSNYGATTVDIFAPGARICSTFPSALYNTSIIGHIAPGYIVQSGTSAASPYVAGVAALLLSHHPSYTAIQLKRVIMDTGITTSGLQCVSGKRVNAYDALTKSVIVHGSYADSTGAGVYSTGATVMIKAGTRGGYVFTGWTVNTGGVSLANPNSPVTTFTKLSNSHNVIVTANWAPDPNFNGYILYDSITEISSATKHFFFWGSQVATGNYFHVAAPASIYLTGPWGYVAGSPVCLNIGWWGDDSHNWYVDVYGGYGGAICIWVEN